MARIIQSDWDEFGGEFTLCPECDAHWYHNDTDADSTGIDWEECPECHGHGCLDYETNKEVQEPCDICEGEGGFRLNPDFCLMYCQNCDTFFNSEYPGNTDPTVAEVEAMFRELFSDAEWNNLTPTDIRSHYNNYTDQLQRDGVISSLMYESMPGHSKG